MQHTPLDCANYSWKSDLISLLKERGGQPNKAYGDGDGGGGDGGGCGGGGC